MYEVDLTFVVRCINRGGEGLLDAYHYTEKILAELRGRNFDFCLNISSSGYTAILVKLLGIPNSHGWVSDDEGYRLITNPWTVLFAAFVFHANRDYNSINLVDIVRCSAGVRKHPLRLHYAIPEEARHFPDTVLRESNLRGSGPLVCIQVGASQDKRQWEPEKFAQLTNRLVTELDARIIFTGSAKERPLVDEVLRHFSHANVYNAAGETKLDHLAAVLERADLLITGDTGPMHLAIAVGTPVVALFLASALCFETGPYSAGNIVLQPQVACNPCNPNFPCARPDCHEQVSPEQVFRMAKLRLAHTAESILEVEVTNDVADPREVVVYVSKFDEDGFLEFKRINGPAHYHGEQTDFYETVRAVYRELWKQEFGAKLMPTEPIASKSTGQRLSVLDSRLDALGEMIALAAQGISAIDRLIAVIRNVHAAPAELGVMNRAIGEIDNKIEELGLSNPVFGALTRVFIMERSNIRGEDPVFLASKAKELYEQLARRSEKFKRLYWEYYSSNGATHPVPSVLGTSRAHERTNEVFHDYRPDR